MTDRYADLRAALNAGPTPGPWTIGNNGYDVIHGDANWDAVQDAKLGKLLLALSGYVPGYDPRTDAVQAALAQEQGESE